MIGHMSAPAATSLPDARIPVPIDAVRSFCARWGVREFALFGSVLRNDFTASSDVDVLITLEDESRRYFGDRLDWEDELGAAFGRKVDVVTRQGIERGRNALRRDSILGSAKVIYARS